MKDRTFYLLIFILVGIPLLVGGISIAFALIPNTSTIDNAGRREYGYCPVDPSTISSRAQLEINGCPLIRAYVTNWNSLTPSDQSTIDSQMRLLGFKDIGEFDNRVK